MNNNQSKILTSTLVNIDSSYRNINPKNICISNNNILPINPLLINNNFITIKYPNHNLEINDNITIQNVKGFSKIISNEFYLINNFKYLLINLLDNNLINLNYSLKININIDIFGDFTESNLLNNIPFNSITGIKNVKLANDIQPIYLNYVINIIKTILKINNNIMDYLNTNCIFIELPTEYLGNNFFNIKQTFKIDYLHINGIPLGYINSNYPINNNNYQSCQTVYDIIDNDTFKIQINYKGYNNNIYSGGNNIIINKIINSIDGYPYNNNYTITLKNTFNNVVDIKLVSSEFPYTDLLIKENVNDKLYWRNIEDGNNIYNIKIDEGFYSPTTLVSKINNLMNKTPRINSTLINKIYNNFNIILDSTSHTITFSSYYLINLSNSLSIRKANITDNNNSDLYFILNIHHPNNLVNVNDTITISNSNIVTFKQVNNDNTVQIFSMASSYINNNFNVYNINKENQSYDVIVGKVKEVAITLINYDSAGGENIIIKTNSKSSFLFDKSDTIGTELGFLNVGDTYSITDFKFIITNSDTYINNLGLNSIGNLSSYNHGFFDFSGTYNYFFMYLNDIEYIYTNNNLPSAFAKLLLSGNPGDILFNTFVEQPNNLYDKIFPISSLDTFTISFLYPDGTPLNFRNIGHSFTLKITEEKIQNENTYLNSKKINLKSIQNK